MSTNNGLPTREEVALERERLLQKRAYFRTMRNIFFVLIVVASMAVLVATLCLPTLQVAGNSMAPTMSENDVIVLWKTETFEKGDLIAFTHNNQVLLKRIVGLPGDWIEIDKKGTVKVNQVIIDEPYVKEKSLGECNIKFPYQVPDGKLFVLGDHRETSIDSRHTSVGSIGREAIIGRVFFRIWPLTHIGNIS